MKAAITAGTSRSSHTDPALDAPRVELLWWSGCPSHPKAKAMLESTMLELGLDPATIETLQVVTEVEAVRERFVGSPTIRVDGRDVVAPREPVQAALTCRLYFRRDGRPGPLPDPDDLRDALAGALKPTNEGA